MCALWGGRFSGRMAPSMVPLNRSLGADFRLWPQDISGSKAWARALAGAGVLTSREGSDLVAGLERVAVVLEGLDPGTVEDEDVHSLVERLLAEDLGSLAGKLHSGRSRNDQVSTDFRLWGMEATGKVEATLLRNLEALVRLAEASVDLLMPGHTHLQQAQPLRAAHWALSHFWPLHRDLQRFRQVADSASSLPLGSGALAGCPFPVDREALREALGFDRVTENSIDAVSDRDWAAELCFAGALLGVHLSRLGEDLVLYSSREFGYLELPEGFCTGSSLMPQKRNPDAAELVRGKSARILGNLNGFLALLKGLPSGYNRDLQEDKEMVFDTVDTLLLVLGAMGDLVGGLRFREAGIREAMSPELLATDLADYLVRRGVPFRESHEVVGRLVRLAEERGETVSSLPLSALQEVHPSFAEDAIDALSFEGSVEARSGKGGTARGAVREQLKAARSALSR